MESLEQLQKTYAGKTDEELAELASDAYDLMEPAPKVLRAEIAKRGLKITLKQAADSQPERSSSEDEDEHEDPDSSLEVPPVSSDTPRPNTALMREATGSETFEDIVEWAYSTLPQRIKDLPDFPGIQVADEPPEGYLETRARRTELLGLFVGVSRAERQTYGLQKTPDLIFVFRGPIMRCSKGDLRSEVKRTVWHEVAHWLGYGERDMKELGL